MTLLTPDRIRSLAFAAFHSYFQEEQAAENKPSVIQLGFSRDPKYYSAEVINSAIMGLMNDGLVIAFRGTLTFDFSSLDGIFNACMDWFQDSQAQFHKPDYSKGQVHLGFHNALDSLWPDIGYVVKGFKGNVFITGHSKGGALATLAAMRVRMVAPLAKIHVVTFGSPRAGDRQFVKQYNSTIRQHIRFENEDDVVPHLPSNNMIVKLLKRHFPLLKSFDMNSFEHVGGLHFLDWRGRTITRDSWKIRTFRFWNLLKAAFFGHIGELGADHSIESGYLAKISRILENGNSIKIYKNIEDGSFISHKQSALRKAA